MGRGKRIDADWLAEHYPRMTDVNELLDDFERDHGWRPTKTSLYMRAYRLGMALYGWYWLLVELLTGRKHHYYDVSDDAGWRRLARDMSCICDMGTDECKEFIAELYNASLINREQYDELQRVTITRILADAKSYAESVASKKIGAWKTNRKKVFG